MIVPRRTALIVFALALTGCTSWRPGYLDGGPIPREVSVTLRDRSVVEIADARVESDTLLVGRGGYPEHVSIPIREIESIRFRTPDAAKTVILMGVTIPALVFGTFALMLSHAYTT